MSSSASLISADALPAAPLLTALERLHPNVDLINVSFGPQTGGPKLIPSAHTKASACVCIFSDVQDSFAVSASWLPGLRRFYWTKSMELTDKLPKAEANISTSFWAWDAPNGDGELISLGRKGWARGRRVSDRTFTRTLFSNYLRVHLILRAQEHEEREHPVNSLCHCCPRACATRLPRPIATSWGSVISRPSTDGFACWAYASWTGHNRFGYNPRETSYHAGPNLGWVRSTFHLGRGSDVAAEIGAPSADADVN